MNNHKNKLSIGHIFIIITTFLLIVVPIGIEYRVHQKNINDTIKKAPFLEDENTKFAGYFSLTDIENSIKSEVTLLSVKEIKNKKPKLLWSWYTIEELNKNPKIQSNKNKKFFVFTRD